MKLRPELNDFSKMMEQRLQAKDHLHPNGWDSDSIEALLNRFEEKVGLLKTSFEFSAPEVTSFVAADAANYLMMIVDKLAKDRANVHVI